MSRARATENFGFDRLTIVILGIMPRIHGASYTMHLLFFVIL